MANKWSFIGVFIVIIVGGLLTFISFAAWQRYRDAQSTLDSEELRFGLDDIRAIKGRLLANPKIRQEETEDVDLTEFKDILIPMLSPCVRSTTMKKDCTDLCNLLLEKQNGQTLSLT